MLTNVTTILNLFEMDIIKNEKELIIALTIHEMIQESAPMDYTLVFLQNVSTDVRQVLQDIYPFL
jgi:hypothetical protein